MSAEIPPTTADLHFRDKNSGNKEKVEEAQQESPEYFAKLALAAYQEYLNYLKTLAWQRTTYVPTVVGPYPIYPTTEQPGTIPYPPYDPNTSSTWCNTPEKANTGCCKDAKHVPISPPKPPY